MPLQTETVHVTGIRCERCVNRLSAALNGHPGLEGAHANLMGHVTLSYDDALTSREALTTAMSKSGFREAPAGAGIG